MTTLALVCLLIAVAVAVYRVVRGPSWGDRITAFDFLSVNSGGAYRGAGNPHRL